MALLIFVVVPLAWAVTGWLLKPVVTLTVPTETGRRLGVVFGRWCPCVFPALYLVLLFLGGSGDAGHGPFLFGSQELFGVLCASFYAVPVLGIYVLLAVVVWDVVRGLRSLWSRRASIAPSSASPPEPNP
jgi:hypothetical protein